MLLTPRGSAGLAWPGMGKPRNQGAALRSVLRLGPAFLFSAIRHNRVRQKNAHAEQTKKCCHNLDHQTHLCGPAQERLSRTSVALTSERLVRYLRRRERSVPLAAARHSDETRAQDGTAGCILAIDLRDQVLQVPSDTRPEEIRPDLAVLKG